MNRENQLRQFLLSWSGSTLMFLWQHSTPAPLAAKRTTQSIPIVISVMADPIGNGLVMSLAGPGRNPTGLTSPASELWPKRLELFKETAANSIRVAMLWNTSNPAMAIGAKLFVMQKIIDSVTNTRLPGMYDENSLIEFGGHMSYGENHADRYRRAGTYINEISNAQIPQICRPSSRPSLNL
jgi:hypothetical protein